MSRAASSIPSPAVAPTIQSRHFAGVSDSDEFRGMFGDPDMATDCTLFGLAMRGANVSGDVYKLCPLVLNNFKQEL